MVQIVKGQPSGRPYSLIGKLKPIALLVIGFIVGQWFSMQSYEMEIHLLETVKISSMKEDIGKLNELYKIGIEQKAQLEATIVELNNQVSELNQKGQKQLDAQLQEFKRVQAASRAAAEDNKRDTEGIRTSQTIDNGSNSYKRFDTSTSHAKGMARIEKDEFVTTFDYGTPMDKGGEVILMYNTDKAIPTGVQIANEVRNSNRDGLPLLSVADATANCDYMTVTTVPPQNKHGQCLAIVQNYDNWHTQKWLRISSEAREKIDSSLPLRSVARGQTDEGRNDFNVPLESDIQQHWSMLKTYFSSIDDILGELKPIAESVAVNNTIIVMTCNRGQSELLMNFVCNARAKGLPLDNVLVFPTDEETQILAEGLGLTTYYDKRNFDDIPETAAGQYMDETFTSMMFAKVVCVQLISSLGYDLLFQDVDVVWFKNPLEYFHDKTNEFYDFDMYFQDDGARSNRYAPMAANSGFYYVRSNPLTKYMFLSLLYHGDMIVQSKSHQQVLIQIMAEHASVFGLRVKVIDRATASFPGGFQYHRRGQLMKQIFSGEVVPEIFHMSWTLNKKDKQKYLEQMGEWYVNSKCVGKTRDAIFGEEREHQRDLSLETPLVEPCCLVEPDIICHYSDKPSKIPCKDSPPIDKGGRSFW